MERGEEWKGESLKIDADMRTQDVAKKVLPHKAYAYYSSSTEDTICEY